MIEKNRDAIFGIGATVRIGTCENCKREKIEIRRFLAIGMFSEPRRYWNICFECYPEQQKFISSRRNEFGQIERKVFYAPIRSDTSRSQPKTGGVADEF